MRQTTEQIGNVTDFDTTTNWEIYAMATDAATEAKTIFDDMQKAKKEPSQDRAEAGTIKKQRSPRALLHAKLFAAMAKARGEMRQPKLDGTNPHFRSKYVTLSGLLEAIMPALAANGLHIWQVPDGDDLLTIVSHESGESMEFRVALPNGGTSQQLGSVLTYLKRYTLASIVGVAGDLDDDGNEAMNAKPAPSQYVTKEQAANLQALAEEVKANIPALLKFCHAKDFAHVPANRLATAISGLEAKR